MRAPQGFRMVRICAHQCLRGGVEQSNSRYKIASEAIVLQHGEQVLLHPVKGFLGIKEYDFFWVGRGESGVDNASSLLMEAIFLKYVPPDNHPVWVIYYYSSD